MSRFPFHRNWLALIPLLFLGACATAPQAPEQAGEPGSETESSAPSDGEAGSSADQAKSGDGADAGERPEDTAETAKAEEEARRAPSPKGLHGENLYRLLVADLAGRKGDVELALQGYLEAARESRDPRIAERAARLALYAGRRAAALEAGQRWVELAPDSREAHAVLGRLYLRDDDAQAAVEHFHRVVSLTSGGTDAGLREVASLLGESPKPQSALEVAERMVDRYPDSAIAYVMVADLAHRGGADERALASVERALDIEPGLTRAEVLRARIRVELGRADEAFADLEAAVESAPQDKALALGYARLLVDAGRRESAVRAMQRTFERFGDNAGAVYTLGLLAMQAEAWSDARIYLERLVAMDERASAAHYYLGRIAEQQEDCTAALRHYIKVGQGEHRFDAEIRAAVCMAEVGRIDEARLHLERLSARYQEDGPGARIVLTRARVERIAGNPEQALKVMSDAVEASPDNIDLRYNRALMAAQMDRFELARSDLQHVLELEPDNARALNALGYMLADRGLQLQKARSMIERALEQNPEDAAVLDSMGWVLHRLGRSREALEYLRAAWERGGDAEIAAHLGEVLWATGQHEAAREVWAAGREIAPDNEVLRETIERLDP